MPVSLHRRSNKVVFFHIGKTGGTTFNGVLSSIFGDSFHFCDDPSIEGIARALESFDCLEFHTLLRRGDWVHMHSELAAQHRWELIDGADIFTMFREPVDQAISLYFHMIEFRERVEPTCKVNGQRSMTMNWTGRLQLPCRLDFLSWTGSQATDPDSIRI